MPNRYIGNAVLLKPAPRMSRVATQFAELAWLAGLDRKLLTILPESVEAVHDAIAPPNHHYKRADTTHDDATADVRRQFRPGFPAAAGVRAGQGVKRFLPWAARVSIKA